MDVWDFNLWNDDAREAIFDFLDACIEKIKVVARSSGQDKHFFHKLDHERRLLHEDHGLRDVSCTLTMPRTDGTSWSNEVRITIGLTENHTEWRKEVKAMERERRGTNMMRFSASVQCRVQAQGEKPQDCARFAKMLAEAANLCVEIEGDLEILIRRSIGNYPEDEAKVKAQEERWRRRNYITAQIESALAEAPLTTRAKVKELVAEIIKTHFLDVDNECAEITLDAKQRKLIKRVPDSVFKVTFKRGKPAEVCLTPKAIESIEQRLQDEAEREASNAA